MNNIELYAGNLVNRLEDSGLLSSDYIRLLDYLVSEDLRFNADFGEFAPAEETMYLLGDLDRILTEHWAGSVLADVTAQRLVRAIEEAI